MLRGYMYTRVSTAMQVDGFSLDAQKDKIKGYAELYDITLVGEYSDEGRSGKNIEGRPQFLKMLEDIKSKKDNIDFLIVYKLSRFGRNTTDIMVTLREIQRCGVELVCVADNIDSSKDTGKLMLAVLSAVAEIERNNIIAQTMAGRERKAKEGKWNGGFAPYGYKLVDGKLEIAEDETEIIKLIYEKYAEGLLGINGVAEYLNNRGYKKKLRQNNSLQGFTNHFVKGVLDNPVYKGKLSYGRRRSEKIEDSDNQYHIVKQKEFSVYEGVHEAIIPETLWDDVHAMREKTGHANPKVHDTDHAYLLTGLLKCPRCGGPMYGNLNRKKRKKGGYYPTTFYYKCGRKIRQDGTKCDYKKHWLEPKVNEAVAEIVMNLIKSPKFETALKEKVSTQINTTEIEKEIENLKKAQHQTEMLKNKLSKEMDSLDFSECYAEKKYSDLSKRQERLYEKLDKIDDEIEVLEERKQVIEKESLNAERVIQILNHFEKIYAVSSDLEKKQLLYLFIEEVHLHEEVQDNWQFLKSIKLRFPVYMDGVEGKEICLKREGTVESVILMTKA